MMGGEASGNGLAAVGPGTRAGLADFASGLLHYQTCITNVLPAADADPTHVLINVYAGILWLLVESPAGPVQAGRYLQRARHAQGPGTPEREALAVALLAAWIEDDIPAALDAAERLLASEPRDLVTFKLHQYLNFNLGRPAEMLRIAAVVEPHHRDSAVFQGTLAFALEQCQLLTEAEAAARRALALREDDPWAQHALAHVLLTQGRIGEGAAFLESVQQGWGVLNSFMRTHLWWHLCLFYLSQGRAQQVLELYDTQVWGVDREYSQDQIGAVSLLARLELAGVDAGARWTELGGHLASRAEDTTQPFLSLQYLYGLGRAGCAEADRLLEAIRQRGRTAPPYSRGVWRDIALPAAEGLLAHARRADPVITAARLGPVLPELLGLGGSHAQRELFEQIWLDALVRAGRLPLAQQRLEQRRLTDPDSVPLNRTLALVYQQLGLPALAQQARERACFRAGRFTPGAGQ
jgi:tetratricopeptide (TPR) repeat protein